LSYNPNIRLNPRQLELIEDALRTEMTKIGHGAKVHLGNFDQPEAMKSIKELDELLAHIHHQKSWYKPKDFVPLG
jgi:hypothetical protein